MNCRSRLVAAVLFVFMTGQAFANTPRTRSAARGDHGASADDLRVTAQLEEIRRQRDAYEAGRLVERGVREQLRGDDAAAEPLFARAVELDPTDERAREGLRGARERLGW